MREDDASGSICPLSGSSENVVITSVLPTRGGSVTVTELWWKTTETCSTVEGAL
jgi:hypothetical protein